jgi:hypothetical protein
MPKALYIWGAAGSMEPDLLRGIQGYSYGDYSTNEI